MGRTVAIGEPCGDAKRHRIQVGELETELVFYRSYLLPLRESWDVSPELLERTWRPFEAVVLSSYWHDMECGCVFGALCCVPVESAAA